MDIDPKQVFEAAIRLSHMPYENGLYWNPLTTGRWWEGCADDEERGRRRMEELEHQLWAHPVTSDPGAIWTTGGLAIYIFRHRPHYIETPWGEWSCWLNPIRGFRESFGPASTFFRLRERLDIDEARSQERITNHRQVLAIRAIDGIELPPYERTYRSLRPLGEWIELCLEHDPPIPLNEHTKWLHGRMIAAA